MGHRVPAAAALGGQGAVPGELGAGLSVSVCLCVCLVCVRLQPPRWSAHAKRVLPCLVPWCDRDILSNPESQVTRGVAVEGQGSCEKDEKGAAKPQIFISCSSSSSHGVATEIFH